MNVPEDRVRAERDGAQLADGDEARPSRELPVLSAIALVAERYVVDRCALDPNYATAIGVPGYEDKLTDFSPEGVEARAELDRNTLVALAGLEPTDAGDRRAAAFMTERLDAALASVDTAEHLRALRIIGSPLQGIRGVFDLMSKGSVSDWELIGRRLAAVPDALAGYRRSLTEGLGRDLTAARRQVEAGAEQARTWAGESGSASFFATFVAASESVDGISPTLSADLDRGARRAADAYGDLARFLLDEYLPRATPVDAVGPDRYSTAARASLGADLDAHEVYDWAWAELARIETEMAVLADQVLPGSSIAEAIDHLETSSSLVIEGEDVLRGWLQQLMDATIDDLDGTHFDIPGPVKRVEAMIAPPGSAAAMYYTGPSEDFSRPGRTWYPTLGKTRFPLWGEVSIAYHEGVPGHHLQVGQVRYQRDKLTRFQRVGFVSGHGEGWALYAERLMDELGKFEQPAYRLGLFRAQALRAVRVIVDIGMHLELVIPTGQGFHPGEQWTPALGQAFVDERSRFPRDFMASEIIRYLGHPGQAISYKVGERAWLAGREAAKARSGSGFDLKTWHRRALDLGPLGLDQLAAELAAC
jgi:uncharacterized protein (DUF885 family)